MKQQMLQKQVEKLTKQNEKLELDSIINNFIITKLREQLLSESEDNLAHIDSVYAEAKKLRTKSKSELSMFKNLGVKEDDGCYIVYEESSDTEEESSDTEIKVLYMSVFKSEDEAYSFIIGLVQPDDYTGVTVSKQRDEKDNLICDIITPVVRRYRIVKY